MTFFDYQAFWPIFPIWILIATTAISTWIDWAVFWAPVLIFWFKLPPEVAIACGIFIEVFWFWSWVYAYFLKWKILFKKVMPLLCIAIIFWLLWSLVAKILPKSIIFFILWASTLFLAYKNIKRTTIKHSKWNNIGEKFNLTALKSPLLWKVLNAIWGFLTWVIWVWLWEVNNYYFLEKNKMSIPYASWNSVFLIAITAFVCSIFNIIWFWNHLAMDQIIKIYSIIIFAIPAVMIWWRIWSIVAHNVNPKLFYYVVSFLFLIVSMLSFYRM